MTLDALASDIDNAAEEEAKAITDAAKSKAQGHCLRSQARTQVSTQRHLI